MAKGLCTAAVTLTSAEMQRLEDLPGAVNEVEEADGCQFLAGHRGRHAFWAQTQWLDGADVEWWVIWDGPARPESQGYEILHHPMCAATEGLESCRHPEGHEGPHRCD